MNPPPPRVLILWAALLLVLGGCTAPGTGSERTLNALGVVAVATVVEGAILVAALRWGVLTLKSPAERFAMFLGTIVGLIASVIIMVSVPLNIQYLIVGGILGLGTNLFATKSQTRSVTTAIGSLAKFVITTAKAVSSAAEDTGLPTPEEIALTIGIWCFLGSILGTLAIGNAFSGVTLFPPREEIRPAPRASPHVSQNTPLFAAKPGVRNS
jgi:hypothetical protein